MFEDIVQQDHVQSGIPGSFGHAASFVPRMAVADDITTDGSRLLSRAGAEAPVAMAPLPWSDGQHPGDAGPSGHGVLYRGPRYSISFTRCCPHDPGKSCSKCVAANSVTFVRRGVFEYHSNETTSLADPTTVLFGRAKEEFKTSHPGCIGDETMILTPQPELLREILSEINARAADDPDRVFENPIAACSNRTFLMHRRVFDLARQSEIDVLELDEATQELLGSVLSEVPQALPTRAKAVRANTVRAHLEISEAARRILASEFAERVMLNDIARRVHTAPFHLCRIFRAHTGMTVHKYLTRIRVRAAVEMLASTTEPLQNVALRVGLCSQSHLCDAFRRELGLSPAKIRRALGDSLRWSLIREASSFQDDGE